MTPSVNRALHTPAAWPAPSVDATAPVQAPPETARLAWRTASTGAGIAKWAVTAGLMASVAGLGTGAIAACTVGAATLGTVIWIGELASLRYGVELPHVTLQHALCNELHTLAGGLLGAAPAAAALTALGAAMAHSNADGTPETGFDGLAMMTAVVAGPMVCLFNAGARSADTDPATGIRQLMVYGLPLLATGAVLVAPAVILQATISPEAASRFVIAFGANMACAVVREGMTQASARAWGGLERNGTGTNYGLSQARGADRAASTILPTAASCLLFAATTSLLIHRLDACCDLGMAPAGQSVLAISAGVAARRTALRYTLAQSTNELLEGIARCLPLAAYARMRHIPLRYRDTGDGLPQVPALLRRNLADPETLRRAALFASARTMDGALINILSQLSAALSPGVFWNDYRIAAMLAQGATMGRTPIVAAWLLPGVEPDVELPCSVVVSIPSATEAGSSDETTLAPDPQSDPSMQWA